MIRPRHRLLSWTSVAVCAVALGACGSSSSSSTTSQPSAEGATARLHAKLPEDLRAAGTLRLASDISYPPFEFYEAGDSKTPVGFDIDLAHALGDVLGVQVQIVPTKFDAILPGLAAGRFDGAISAIGDAPERRSQADFVDYAKISGGILVRADDDDAPAKLADLCGRTVAVQKGSNQVTDAQEQSQRCQRQGDPAVRVQQYPSAPDLLLALQSERADAALYDTASGGYQVKQSDGRFELGEPYGRSINDGIVLPKGEDELVEAVRAAVQELMDNGTYRQLLDKWGLSANALTRATVNNS